MHCALRALQRCSIMEASWDEAISTEMHFASIIEEQQDFGWLVDTPRMTELVSRLDVDMVDMALRIEPTLPLCPMNIGELKKVTKDVIIGHFDQYINTRAEIERKSREDKLNNDLERFLNNIGEDANETQGPTATV